MKPDTDSAFSSIIINSFLHIENELAEILSVVPYCTEHENVWSPLLIPLMLDSCSQLDSLWKQKVKRSKYTKRKRLGMTDYFHVFGRSVSSRKLVFFGGEETRVLEPFDSWATLSHFDIDDYVKLDWWQSYNNIKHDRLANRKVATLENTVLSIAALFLAMIDTDFCHLGIIQAGLVSSEYDDLEASISEDSPSYYPGYTIVESKLFAYPVGYRGKSISANETWFGVGTSQRFKQWFDCFVGQL